MSKRASPDGPTPSESPLNNISEERSGALMDFADVAERVGATTKRTEKATLLGNYFSSLSDNDLAHAARYFAGYVFPLRDQRTINIGGAALLTAIAAVSGEEKSALQVKLVKLGDPGDVAAEVFTNTPPVKQHQPTLTLQELSDTLEQLAVTTGTRRKLERVTSLLKIATPLEAKYIVKLLAGDLRIGLKEGAVEDAIARLANINIARVQWVNMLTGDIGETALLARHEQLDKAQMRLFHPIKFMLASPAADATEVAKQMPECFAVEDKYDGIRAQIHTAPVESDNEILHGAVYNGRRVALFSRTLDEITPSFPDLIEPLAGVIPAEPAMVEEAKVTRCETRSESETAGLILDGEIVPVRGDDILPFKKCKSDSDARVFHKSC